MDFDELDATDATLEQICRTLTWNAIKDVVGAATRQIIQDALYDNDVFDTAGIGDTVFEAIDGAMDEL